ncbi:hypothetical protein NKH77_31825 [Streptomyces sp. M19]
MAREHVVQQAAAPRDAERTSRTSWMSEASGRPIPADARTARVYA